MSEDDRLKYDEAGQCIASPYRRGLRAFGTNPRALGISSRAKTRTAARKRKRGKRERGDKP
jgi:hypothetical protein